MSHSFRTEINCSPTKPIDLHHKVATLGSCFADQFGQWMKTNKFEVLVNPFGTTYNPVSIHQLILSSVENDLDESLFLERDGSWYHHHYHSSWTASTREQLDQAIRKQQQLIKEFIHHTDILILTYGTAWVYQIQKNNALVANCHKVPANVFAKKILEEKEILASFDELYKKLRTLHPTLRIIVTVSPVRHTKDTLELNSVSKGLLRWMCHTITERYDYVEYFPAYEIMMDDLRDYRFYERDMIHPSAEARDYINQNFSDRYFTPETKQLIKSLNEIQKALAHRPFQIAAPAHQKFLKETLHKLESMKSIVSVEEEIKLVQSHLAHA